MSDSSSVNPAICDVKTTTSTDAITDTVTDVITDAFMDDDATKAHTMPWRMMWKHCISVVAVSRYMVKRTMKSGLHVNAASLLFGFVIRISVLNLCGSMRLAATERNAIWLSVWRSELLV